MRLQLSIVVLLLICAAASAQDELAFGGRKRSSPADCPCPPAQLGAPAPIDPSQPPPTPTPETAPPATDAFRQALASAGESGTQSGGSYAPAFFGDFLSGSGTKRVGTGGPFVFAPINRHAGAYKIVDNESPRPTDRLFYFYNEFSNVFTDINPVIGPINLQRHVLGFEKKFFNGWASVGMRLPFVITDGPPDIATRQFADMTIVTKLALWDNPQTGSIISTGLAITVPTGQLETFITPNSGNLYQLSDTIIQPYVGWIWSPRSRFFAHGFTSLAAPTDSRDALVMFNDVGVGVWLYRDFGAAGLRGIVPTMELHVNTPLNRRGVTSFPLGYLDSVNMMWGGNLIFARAVLGGAVGVPLSSPRPFGVEAMARCELRF